MKQNLTITSAFNEKQLDSIGQGLQSLLLSQRCFFAVSKGSTTTVKPLSEVLIKDANIKEILSENLFGFLDPSNSENPGWPLRMFLAALLQLYPDLESADVNVVGLRHSPRGSVENSRVFTVQIPQVSSTI